MLFLLLGSCFYLPRNTGYKQLKETEAPSHDAASATVQQTEPYRFPSYRFTKNLRIVRLFTTSLDPGFCQAHITLHYITLHYITLHYITLHYIALHCITLHYMAFGYIAFYYMTLHCIPLYYITLQYNTLRYITLHCSTLHYIALHDIT